MCLMAQELVKQIVIMSSTPAISYFALYLDGIVCRSKNGMKKHLKGVRSWRTGERGGKPIRFL